MMDKRTSLRFAFVGCGWVVRTVWLPLLLETDVEVVTLIDPDSGAFSEAVSQLPGVHIGIHLSQAVAAKCDVAFICSPNTNHVEHAIEALGMGLNVIVEKPACFSLADADRLISASKAARKVIMVTSASSYRTDTMQLMEWSRDQQFGELHCIDASWRRRSGIPRPGSWFTTAETAVGGSGADLGWHVLEVALGTLGYPLVTNGLSRVIQPDVVDEQQMAMWRSDAAGETAVVDVDTQMFACLQTQTGALIRVTTAWCSEQPVDETSFVVYGSSGEMKLVCTFGFSPQASDRNGLLLSRGGTTESLFCAEEKLEPYRRFITAMLEYVTTPWQDDNEQMRMEHRKLRSLGSAMQALYPKSDPKESMA